MVPNFLESCIKVVDVITLSEGLTSKLYVRGNTLSPLFPLLRPQRLEKRPVRALREAEICVRKEAALVGHSVSLAFWSRCFAEVTHRLQNVQPAKAKSTPQIRSTEDLTKKLQVNNIAKIAIRSDCEVRFYKFARSEEFALPLLREVGLLRLRLDRPIGANTALPFVPPPSDKY